MAEKHPDQVKRELIPSRADVPTMFHPYHDLIMVKPIPDIDHVGSIILPDKAKILMNEGHVLEKGPLCTDALGIGDCVTWDANSEYRMTVDDVPFVLVRESVINMRIPAAELRGENDPNQLKLPISEGEDEVPDGPIVCKWCHQMPCTCPQAAPQRRCTSKDYKCSACGEWSPVSREDVNHAVDCPEREKQ